VEQVQAVPIMLFWYRFKSSPRLSEWILNFESLMAEKSLRNLAPIVTTALEPGNLAYPSSDEVDWRFDLGANEFDYDFN
jgi:hypothetical protein